MAGFWKVFRFFGNSKQLREDARTLYDLIPSGGQGITGLDLHLNSSLGFDRVYPALSYLSRKKLVFFSDANLPKPRKRYYRRTPRMAEEKDFQL